MAKPKPRISSWAVGITTAPRPAETLTRTMESLVDAGWDRATIYAEPASPLPLVDPEHWQTVQWPRPLGCWKNWIAGLAHLRTSNPLADAYMMVQDDVVFCRGLRAYLEATLWPGNGPVGVCSPYSPEAYARDGRRRWHRQDRGWYLVGALCWVIPPAAAGQFVGALGGKDFEHRIDARIGRWCGNHGRAVWYHTPSLAQHIGCRVSALGDGLVTDLRRACDFIGRNNTP